MNGPRRNGNRRIVDGCSRAQPQVCCAPVVAQSRIYRDRHHHPGLSIGANTAIFAMVNALMLKSLPYPHPERMGTIYTQVTVSRASDERHKLNGEQWELLRDSAPSLISAVSSPGASGVNLVWGSQGQYLRAGRISAHYL